MIRLGIRLTVATGREALVRLAIIASAVALGVGLLLGTLAAMNAVSTQNGRNAWLNSAVLPSRATPDSAPIWWRFSVDGLDGRIFYRVDAAATGPNSTSVPGTARLPGPGEYYASPALSELIRAKPAAELADRMPGREIGVIGDAGLASPDSLILLVGHTPDELRTYRNARQVSGISTIAPDHCQGCDVGINANGMDLTLSVVGAALIFPLIVLVGTATRLAATRREQRFAAMRLVGATPRQVSVISAVESTIAAFIGVVAGFAVYFLGRPAVRDVPLGKGRFFLSDVTLTWPDVVLVAVGVPLLATVSARVALRRVQISPLGATRRATPKPPRARRVVPLAAGLLEIAYFIGRRPVTTGGQTAAFLPGILLILGGLVLAGPWLTMAGARFMARHTSRPAQLIAGRRLADDPRAGFRAVSGLILALCTTTMGVGVITGMAAREGGLGQGPADNVLIGNYSGIHKGQESAAEAPPSDALLAQLRSVPGVLGLTVVHSSVPATQTRPAGEQGAGDDVALCSQLATTPQFSVCPAGVEVASISRDFRELGLFASDDWPRLWSAAPVSADRLRELPVTQIAVATDGSLSAIDRAKTLLANAYPTEPGAHTIAEDRIWQQQRFSGEKLMAEIVIGISLPIAGCSLAVAVAGGLSDRKRPFSLLRLSGVQLGTLRRVVLLESAAPMLISAAVAIATGFLAAHLFLEAQMQLPLSAPGIGYYVIVVVGIAASLGVIASTLPLLRRITGPEVARNE